MVSGTDVKAVFSAYEAIEEAAKGLDMKKTEDATEFKKRFTKLRASRPELSDVTIVCPMTGTLQTPEARMKRFVTAVLSTMAAVLVQRCAASTSHESVPAAQGNNGSLRQPGKLNASSITRQFQDGSTYTIGPK